MKKLTYYLKQLLPLNYWSKYKTPDGNTNVAIWSQWFGKVFNHCHFTVYDAKQDLINALRKYVENH